MTVTAISSIDSNSRRQGCLFPMAEGAVVGSVAGLALKYTYPVTAQEKNSPEYQRVLKEINSKRSIYGVENEAYINSIRSKKELSLAEDTFVKMYDGMKEGDRISFGPKKLRELYTSLREKNSVSAQEFRMLLHKASEASQETVRRCIEAYNVATKNIRPTAFFVVGGAVVGALIALVHDVLRTDVKR